MFELAIKREISIGEVEDKRLVDAVMRFSFLTGYETKSYTDTEKRITLKGGTVMSLDPNSLKHTVAIDYDAESLTIKACTRVFPWARTKEREIMSHRVTQLIKHLHADGIASSESVSEEERAVSVVRAPFTHLPDKRILYNMPAASTQGLSMFTSILGVVLWMWIYGILVIGVKDSRLFLEVLGGTITTAKLIGGASVIGIAVGYAVGGLLSVYFSLSEVFSYLNRRILSFAVFFALIMCFFIIEEEAFIISSLLAMAVPFVSYTFYYLVWGLKKVYIKGD
jgi:hypothetical protein